MDLNLLSSFLWITVDTLGRKSNNMYVLGLVSRKSYLLLGYFFCLLIWWVSLQLSGFTDTLTNYFFGLSFGLIPLIGGILGIHTSTKWGSYTSYFGRAVLFISLGLISWGLGNCLWAYFNLVLHVEVPFPSLADLLFVVSWPLWLVGMLNLSKATGAKYSLKRAYGKVFLLIIPALAFLVTYYVVKFASGGGLDISGGPLATFFVFAYPVGDVVILSMSLLVYGLSFGYLGGRYNLFISILLISFIVNYFGDMGFSYTTTTNSYFNGNWVDLTFALAFFMMGFAVNSLQPER